jgi:hypothetical protein
VVDMGDDGKVADEVHGRCLSAARQNKGAPIQCPLCRRKDVEL